MARLLVCCALLVLIFEGHVVSSSRVKRQLIPREFQNIDLDRFLQNRRAVRYQLRCIIDEGPCDKLGRYLQLMIPVVVNTDCAICNSEQRENVDRVFNHIERNYPREWEKANRKYRPASLEQRLLNLFG